MRGGVNIPLVYSVLSSLYITLLSYVVERPVAPVVRHMLVLVNPFSGPGKAPTIFKEKIQPMFDEAGVTFTLIETGQFIS